MKRLLFYVVAIAGAMSCDKTTIDEFDTSGGDSAASGQTTFVTMNLSLENQTRMSVSEGAESTDPWTTQWSEGDYICVYSIEDDKAKYLNYVAGTSGEATFSGEVYSGKNRVFYTRTQSCSTDNGKVAVSLAPYSSLAELRDFTMISSEVIEIGGDGTTSSDDIYITMQHLTSAIDLQVEFTGVPEGLSFSVSSFKVGGVPSGGSNYVNFTDGVLIDPSKGVDDDDFSSVSSYLSTSVEYSFDEAVEVTSTGVAYDVSILAAPFTMAAGEMIYANVSFEYAGIQYSKELPITNTTGEEFTFARATHSYIKKSFDLGSIFDGMWLGELKAFDNSGGASEDSPIEISTEGELAYLSAIAGGLIEGESADSKYYKLTADLDLGGKTWSPIGSSDLPFSGNLDGGDHTISNLTINNTSSYQGLFGSVDGSTIKNLKLSNPAISAGSYYIGAICGEVDNATITSCCVKDGGYVKSTVMYCGGLVGVISSTTISGCYNEATVQCSTSASYTGKYFGGIVGYGSFKGELIACYNSGAVSGRSYVGGVIGSMASVYSTVIGCYNIGEVTAEDSDAGAVTGEKKNDSSTISGCYYIASTDLDSYATRLTTTSQLNNRVGNMNEAAGDDYYTAGSPADQYLPNLMGESIEFSVDYDTTEDFTPGGTLNGDGE